MLEKIRFLLCFATGIGIAISDFGCHLNFTQLLDEQVA